MTLLQRRYAAAPHPENLYAVAHALDAYGWALHRAGRIDEARTHRDKALAVGVKDPELLAPPRQSDR